MRHQATLREMDGQFICSRCGMLNPTEDTPCLPMNLEPAVGQPEEQEG